MAEPSKSGAKNSHAGLEPSLQGDSSAAPNFVFDLAKFHKDSAMVDAAFADRRAHELAFNREIAEKHPPTDEVEIQTDVEGAPRGVFETTLSEDEFDQLLGDAAHDTLAELYKGEDLWWQSHPNLCGLGSSSASEFGGATIDDSEDIVDGIGTMVDDSGDMVYGIGSIVVDQEPYSSHSSARSDDYFEVRNQLNDFVNNPGTPAYDIGYDFDQGQDVSESEQTAIADVDSSYQGSQSNLGAAGDRDEYYQAEGSGASEVSRSLSPVPTKEELQRLIDRIRAFASPETRSSYLREEDAGSNFTPAAGTFEDKDFSQHPGIDNQDYNHGDISEDTDQEDFQTGFHCDDEDMDDCYLN